MKKLFSIIIIAALFSATAIYVNAQDNTPAKKQSTSQNSQGPNYVDKDKDGTCDNKDNPNKTRQHKNFVDEDNDGNCDKKGQKCGKNQGKKNGKCHKGNNGQRNR